MQRVSVKPLSCALALAVVSTLCIVPLAEAQEGPGWVSLFDGQSISSAWNRVGDTNWRVEYGCIISMIRFRQSNTSNR